MPFDERRTTAIKKELILTGKDYNISSGPKQLTMTVGELIKNV
jgi:hypothetical protein